MPPPQFIQLRQLTQQETHAARIYTSSAPCLHHLMQGRDGLGCKAFEREIDPLIDLVRHLVTAAETHKLERPLELFSGLGNGYSAIGGFWENRPEALVGLELTYGGVFSTSTERLVAEKFLVAGNTARPVFLSIEAQPGLRGLPTDILGPDNGYEAEIIVAANTPFRIIDGKRLNGPKGEFIHLTLVSL